jgi:ABC-type phosphate/phosphonate transport system permease subunit
MGFIIGVSLGLIAAMLALIGAIISAAGKMVVELTEDADDA